MDSPLTINITMNGKAMRYLREAVSCFPCPKLDIKRQNICFYAHETLQDINCSRCTLNNNKKKKTHQSQNMCRHNGTDHLYTQLFNC